MYKVSLYTDGKVTIEPTPSDESKWAGVVDFTGPNGSGKFVVAETPDLAIDSLVSSFEKRISGYLAEISKLRSDIALLYSYHTSNYA